MKMLQWKRKLYIPALSIIAAAAILLGLTGYSTYRNLNRAEKRAVENAYRQGSMLLSVIESGARAGMHLPMWGEDSVRRLFAEIAKDNDISYIYLISPNGELSHHSVPSLKGYTALWAPIVLQGEKAVSRMRLLQDGSRVFDLAKRFQPMPIARDKRIQMYVRHPHEHHDDILVIGLSMKGYDQSKADDRHHTYFMAAIIVALGTGTFFFLFVIQNYYLVGKTLKQTQDYTREVVRSMADGLISLDLDGCVVAYNPRAARILGIDASVLEGYSLEDSLDFDKTGIRRTLSNGKPTLNREIQVFKDPHENAIPLSLSVTPIKGSTGNISGAVVLIKDLSKIKRLEGKLKRAETLAAVGQMAASLAHEIRNPLSSIKGFAQLLKGALKDKPETHAYANLMVGEVERINSVIEDLLFFSRPAEPNMQPVDIVNLCNRCVNLVLADAKSKSITITKQVESKIGSINLDENQMTQALLNMLLNAIDAVCANSHITIFADITENNSLMRIGVADNGTGIPPDNQDKLFTPFHTTKEKGTGLGLSIVKKIAESHGGSITVESPPAGEIKGSRFTIKIPIDRQGHIV